MRKRWFWYAIGLCLALFVVGWIAISNARAQFAPPPPGTPGVGGVEMPPMMPPMMGFGRAGVQLTANNDYVFVLIGSTLYQYDAKTLQQKNKVELPIPQPQFQPPAGRQGGRQGQ